MLFDVRHVHIPVVAAEEMSAVTQVEADITLVEEAPRCGVFFGCSQSLFTDRFKIFACGIRTKVFVLGTRRFIVATRTDVNAVGGVGGN